MALITSYTAIPNMFNEIIRKRVADYVDGEFRIMSNDSLNESPNKMAVHFSSATDLWATPQDLFNRLNAVHHFTLDVCATPQNAKCREYFTPEMDGLKQAWHGVCWMNPPYGRSIKAWMKKAYESSLTRHPVDGAKVVCLVPARTDTAWWHDYAMKGQIEFLRGRLKFGDAVNSAPFPSAIVIFEPKRIQA